MFSDSVLHIDCAISEDEFDEGAKKILKVIRPSWKSEDIQLQAFMGGFSNKVFGCSLGNCYEETKKCDAVVLRINGSGLDGIVDRKREKERFQVLCQAGIAPQMHCVFNNGMVYGFFQGVQLDQGTIREPVIQRLIAEGMVRFHEVKMFYADTCQESPRSELQARMQMLVDAIPTRFDDSTKQKLFSSTIPSKSKLQTELDTIMRELDSLDMEIVFCHNDLQQRNIIYNKNKGTIHFIDYELAFYNYEAYDIAKHFAGYSSKKDENFHRYPSKEEQLPWLRYYLQVKAESKGLSKHSVTVTDVERLFLQTNKCVCAAHFFVTAWSLIQAKHSTIDFDFISYAKLRLTEYFRRKNEFFQLQLPSF